MSKYCHVINLYLESLWVMRVVIRADCREIGDKRLMERTMDGKEPGPVFSFVSCGRMPCLRVHHTKILIKNSLTRSPEAAQSPEDWLIYTRPWVQSPASHKRDVVVHTCQHLRGGSRRTHGLKSSFDYLESSRSTWVPWNPVSRTSIYPFLCIFKLMASLVNFSEHPNLVPIADSFVLSKWIASGSINTHGSWLLMFGYSLGQPFLISLPWITVCRASISCALTDTAVISRWCSKHSSKAQECLSLLS